jgi:hypothetical protein
MSKERTNGLSLVINNSGHIAFNADVNFSVEEKDEVKSVHISDVLSTLVLDALKKQGQNAQLFPGDYRLVLTVCASQINNVVNQEVDNASTVAETVVGTGDETENVSEEASTEGTEVQEETEETEREVSVDEV